MSGMPETGERDETPGVNIREAAAQNIPEELKQRDQWVCWAHKERDGSRAKVPMEPSGTGEFASTTDDTTWGTFETAVQTAYERGWGIGFVFKDGDPYIGIDIDNGVDGEEVREWVPSLEDIEEGYIEYSPSGEGLHVILRDVTIPDWGKLQKDEHGREVVPYSSKRFFTVTGKAFATGTAEIGSSLQFQDWLEKCASALGIDIDPDWNTDHEQDTDLDVYDVLPSSMYPEEERMTHPFHGSETGANFMVDEGGETFRCWRHDITGNALYLIGMEQGIISCGDWDTGLDKETWRDIFDAARDAGYDVDTPTTQETLTKKYTSIAAAIGEEPTDWIDPEEQTITVHALPNADMTVDEVRHVFEEQEMEILRDFLGALAGTDYASALNEFMTEPEAWTVKDAQPADPWARVLAMYDASNVPKKTARKEAYDVLRARYTFATVKETDEILWYTDGIFEDHGDKRIKEELERHLGHHYSTYEANQIVDRIRAATYRELDEFGADRQDPKVCLENGVLHLEDRTFTEHSPDHLFLTKLQVRYEPEAECPHFDSFLDDILDVSEDETDKHVIYEMLGYCLWPSYDLANKFLILQGDGANGKSTLLDVFNEFLGDNTTDWDLQELESNRFAMAELHGALANIGSDLPDIKLQHTGTIKKLTGDDDVMGEKKHKDPFSFKNRAKMIFAANRPPIIDDPSRAIYRRLLLVELPYTFTRRDDEYPDAEPAHKLKQRLTTEAELSGILNRALDGLDEVRNAGFSQNETPAEMKARYTTVSDPIARFAQECLTNDTVKKVVKQDVHQAYNRWAQENGMPPKDGNVFHRKLNQYHDIDLRESRPTIGDSRQRVYENLTFTDTGWEYAPVDQTADAEARERGPKEFPSDRF